MDPTGLGLLLRVRCFQLLLSVNPLRNCTKKTYSEITAWIFKSNENETFCNASLLRKQKAHVFSKQILFFLITIIWRCWTCSQPKTKTGNEPAMNRERTGNEPGTNRERTGNEPGTNRERTRNDANKASENVRKTRNF